MGNLEISHDILLAGADFESCRKRVERFFDRTMLIRYDEVLVLENESIGGTEKEFSTRLHLQGVEKGYVSKVFHTIAHLLDGFIGIDSRFYNLEEDSHDISRDLQQNILAVPHNYWIIKVKGRIASAKSEDPFHVLRTFEWKGKSND